MDTRPLDVAAVQLWSDLDHQPEANRWHALAMLERAAAERPDLVVLPEAVAMLCYPDGRPDFTYRDVAEPVPGPTTEAAGGIARRYGVDVVLGLIADRGPKRPCQNVAVVIGRDGRVAGTYEKTHEPEVCRAEQAAGRGEALPVIETESGRLGVFVCWDVMAPEATSILALKGAELLVYPHLNAFPAQRNLAVLLRARAVDAALPLVAAGMRDAHNHAGSQDGLFPTCLLDADGHVVAQSTVAGPDVVRGRLRLGPVRVDHMGRAEAGLDWREQRRRELRPGLYAREYAALARSPSPPTTDRDAEPSP